MEHPLRVWRRTNRYSQKAVAEMAGLSQAAIGYYETGTNFPRRKHIRKLCEVTGLEPKDFYDFEPQAQA